MNVWVYSFYDPESGELLHKGTAKELSDAGVFCHPTRLGNLWAKYQRQLLKGIPQKWRIEREKQEVKLVRKPRTLGEGGKTKKLPPSARALRPHPSAGADTFSRPGEGFPREGASGDRKRRGEGKATKAEQAAKNAKSRFERMIKDPTPLQQDVHELCLYNEEAARLGRRKLSYGEWAAKGKPDAESLRGVKLPQSALSAAQSADG